MMLKINKKNARHKDKYNAGNKIKKENKNARHKINMMLKINKKCKT